MDISDISRIRYALECELKQEQEAYRFPVLEREQHGRAWKLKVKANRDNNRALDQSFEGAKVWWPGPPKGEAEVLSILPYSATIILRGAKVDPPDRSQTLWLYPPEFLTPLSELWKNREFAVEALRWEQELKDMDAPASSDIPTPDIFPELREKQVEAFKLLGFKAGLLWGPPGTGKTYTLGRMLARLLTQFPDKRVLLLSSTNSAVDLALVAVDQALESLGSDTEAKRARNQCSRLGSKFIAGNYQGRKHLLPVDKPELVEQLAALEEAKPNKEQVQQYLQWHEQIEQLRKRLSPRSASALATSRLVAGTTTGATFIFDQLQAAAPFDLLVLDEASQVPRVHFLDLACLANSVLVTGDFKQLSPIVSSGHPDALSWIGQSPFFYRDKVVEQATVLLDEQSRMSEEICAVVSGAFYDHKLKVAADALNDEAWKQERSLPDVSPLGKRSANIIDMERDGRWHDRWRGEVRFCGGDQLAQMMPGLLETTRPEDILVLTPFRAQRRLFRDRLRNEISGNEEIKRKARRVKVSTVHSAQGREAHTVIFDPVNGAGKFLTQESGQQIINVALSRAKARLIVFLSSGDRKNKQLDQVYRIIKAQQEDTSSYKPISEYIEDRPNFPENLRWTPKSGQLWTPEKRPVQGFIPGVKALYCPAVKAC